MKPTEDCIFSPNKNQDNISNKSTELFTILGSHTFIDDADRPRVNADKDALAKKLITNDSTKYYIKIGHNGRIFNPMGMFSEGKNNKFLSQAGRKEYEFKQVNRDIFDMYVNFLSTKNIAWLNNAERSLI